jgi:hypothetical protein
VLADERQVVEAAGPARVLVYFLQRDQVGAQPLDQGGDLEEVGPDPGGGAEALVHRHRAPAMGDIERQETQPRHMPAT